MIISDAKRAEFEAVAKPLIKFLNDNCHPHTSVHVTCTSAEISEGVCAISTNEFIEAFKY